MDGNGSLDAVNARNAATDPQFTPMLDAGDILSGRAIVSSGDGRRGARIRTVEPQPTPPANVRRETHRRIAVAKIYDAVPEPKTIPEMVRLVESDYQFWLGRRVLTSLISAVPVTWEVSAGEGQAADVESLKDSFAALWAKTLPMALDCIAYGRVAFEKRWRRGIDRWEIKSLDPLPFARSEMQLTSEGEFAGVSFRPADGGSPIPVPPADVWWLALDATPAEPHGRSRYLGAPLKVWRDRCELRKAHKIAIRKGARGNMMMKAPAEYPVDPSRPVGRGDIGELDEQGRPISPMTDAAVMLSSLADGDSAVVQSGNYPAEQGGGPLYEFDQKIPPLNALPFENEQKRLDAAVLRSLGIPERAVTQDDATGSYAMAEVHWDVLSDTCMGILTQIVESFTAYVVMKVIEVNYPPGMRPTLTPVVGKIKRDQKLLAADIAKLVLPSPAVTPAMAAVDVPKLLELAGLPLVADPERAMQEAASAAAAAQPMAGPAGPGFSLSLDALPADEEPPVSDWPTIAAQLREQILARSASIATALNSRSPADARRSLRRDPDGSPP